MNNRNGSGFPPRLPPNVPILGQAPVEAEAVPAQVRLDVKEAVGSAIASMRKLGMRHGRVILSNPLNSNDLGYLLWLDCLVEAGCSLVSTCEVLVPDPRDPRRPVIQVDVVYRLPAEFDA